MKNEKHHLWPDQDLVLWNLCDQNSSKDNIYSSLSDSFRRLQFVMLPKSLSVIWLIFWLSNYAVRLRSIVCYLVSKQPEETKNSWKSDAVEESHDLEEPSKVFRRIHPCKAVLQVHRVPQGKHCILEQWCIILCTTIIPCFKLGQIVLRNHLSWSRFLIDPNLVSVSHK